MRKLLLGVIWMTISMGAAGAAGRPQEATVSLPEPTIVGEVTLEEVLAERRSVREYTDEPLSLRTIAQLAWAAQGVSDAGSGFRTAPSAGATFPIEVDLVINGADGLQDGVYRYDPRDHALRLRLEGDMRLELHQAALLQAWVRDAPLVIVVSGVVARTEGRYGERAERYVHMEAGHVAQNVYLQAQALGLGTVAVGAFDEEAVASVLELDGGQRALYLLPVGRPR